MPQDRLRSPRGSHGRRLTMLTDFEFRVWDQYQLSSDDFGVMRCSAITVMADNDSLAERKPEDVQGALERIIAVGLALAFEHQGRAYMCQSDWQSFQKVEYPRATTLPKPHEQTLALCDAATQRLFRKHPGGWKGKHAKTGRNTGRSPEGRTEGAPEGEPEGSPEDLPNFRRKPLAVSNSSSSSSSQAVPPPTAPARDAGDSPHERVLDAYRQAWKRAYGYESSVLVKPLEFADLSQHIDAHGEARMLEAITAYFGTPDEYVRRAKHPLGLFLRDPLKHLARTAKPAAEPPKNCKHTPPCADDAQHTARAAAERRQVPA